MPKIKGGYILQPRAIDDAWIAKSPPHIREIWLYLLRKANHADCPKYKLKRGQLRTSYREIIDDLSWTVGYRKESYKRTNCETAMRALTREGMITTAKSIRGMVVTICKYDFYQNPKNYEVDTEVDTEVDNENINESTRYTRRIKNDKNDKNIIKKEPINPISDLRDKFELSLDWAGLLNDWLEYKKAKGQTYKSDRSIKSFITKLRNLSNSDWFIAKQIVEDSMANNWAGIFKLKNNENNGITAKQQQRHKVAGDVYQDLLSNVFSENDK